METSSRPVPVTIPSAGISYVLHCGCTAVHLPGTMTRIPRIGDVRPCPNHGRACRIEVTWSNL